MGKFLYFLIIAQILIFLQISSANNNNNNNNVSQSRIIGGKSAKLGILPYQIEYEYENKHWCGGSIIHPKIILLAAHCVEWLDPKLMKIRAGSIERQKGGYITNVDKYIVHPNYYVPDYDVALVKLKSNLPIDNRTMKVIELAQSNYQIPSNTRAVVSGWGYTNENGNLPERLQYVIVPILHDQICREKLDDDFTPRNLCAGDLKRGGIDACTSDSGGPLVQIKNLLQIGVVANGQGCGHADKPGVYTKVSVVRDWIDKAMAKLLNS